MTETAAYSISHIKKQEIRTVFKLHNAKQKKLQKIS